MWILSIENVGLVEMDSTLYVDFSSKTISKISGYMVFGVFCRFDMDLKKSPKSAKNDIINFWLYGFGAILKIYHIHIKKCWKKGMISDPIFGSPDPTLRGSISITIGS